MSSTAVLLFGRFAGPHAGHRYLANLAHQFDADVYIVPTKTHDKKTNPLPFEDKVQVLKRVMGPYAGSVRDDMPGTIIGVLQQLSTKHKNLIMLCGSDREEQYSRLVNAYNHLQYEFETVEIVGVQRNDDSVIGQCSGTRQRQAVQDRDYRTFIQGLPAMSTENAVFVYNTMCGCIPKVNIENVL